MAWEYIFVEVPWSTVGTLIVSKGFLLFWKESSAFSTSSFVFTSSMAHWYCISILWYRSTSPPSRNTSSITFHSWTSSVSFKFFSIVFFHTSMILLFIFCLNVSCIRVGITSSPAGNQFCQTRRPRWLLPSVYQTTRLFPDGSFSYFVISSVLPAS